MRVLLGILGGFLICFRLGATPIVTTLSCIGQDQDQYEFSISFNDVDWLVIRYTPVTELRFSTDKISFKSSNGRFDHVLSRITGRLSTVDTITGITQTPFVCGVAKPKF